MEPCCLGPTHYNEGNDSSTGIFQGSTLCLGDVLFSTLTLSSLDDSDTPSRHREKSPDITTCPIVCKINSDKSDGERHYSGSQSMDTGLVIRDW